jgi:hypothetical protein
MACGDVRCSKSCMSHSSSVPVRKGNVWAVDHQLERGELRLQANARSQEGEVRPAVGKRGVRQCA